MNVAPSLRQRRLVPTALLIALSAASLTACAQDPAADDASDDATPPPAAVVDPDAEPAG